MALLTANQPSLLGELFRVGKRPNAFLKLIGATSITALGGIMLTTAREFPIGVTFTLRNPAQPARLEGANAPAPTSTGIAQNTNVVQIYHESVAATYMAQSDKTLAGVMALPLGEAQGEPVNPRSMSWQIEQTLAIMAQDLNWSALNGVFANPADPTGTALKSRGILTAIVSNVVDQSAVAANTVTAAVYRDYVDQALQAAVVANGYNPDGDWYVFVDAQQYKNIQRAYYGQTTPPYDRNVAGLQIRVIHTSFGTISLVLEPDMPANTLGVFNLSNVGLVGMEVPGKGVFFNEMIAKTGSADTEQLYGQIGIDHAQEQSHAKLLLPAGVAISA